MFSIYVISDLLIRNGQREEVRLFLLQQVGSLAAGLDSGRADEVGREVVGGECFDIHFHK